MDWYGMTDKAILRELGRRLQRRRPELNIRQEDLAHQAGISRMTISAVERGEPATTLTLVQILRALGDLENLDGFLPDPGISPLQIAKLKGKERQRASRSKEDQE